MKAMWDSAVLEDKKKIAPQPSPPRLKQLSDQRGVAHVFHGSDFFYTRTSPLNTAWNATFTSLVYFCMHRKKYSWCAHFNQVYYWRPWIKRRPRFTPDIFGMIKYELHTPLSTWIPNVRIVCTFLLQTTVFMYFLESNYDFFFIRLYCIYWYCDWLKKSFNHIIQMPRSGLCVWLR